MDEKIERDVSDRSWFAWANHVLPELERQGKCNTQLKEENRVQGIDIARLKLQVKIMWGSLTAMGGILIWLIKR
jgi:hypothetical protein